MKAIIDAILALIKKIFARFGNDDAAGVVEDVQTAIDEIAAEIEAE